MIQICLSVKRRWYLNQNSVNQDVYLIANCVLWIVALQERMQLNWIVLLEGLERTHQIVVIFSIRLLWIGQTLMTIYKQLQNQQNTLTHLIRSLQLLWLLILLAGYRRGNGCSCQWISLRLMSVLGPRPAKLYLLLLSSFKTTCLIMETQAEVATWQPQ